VLPRFEPTHRDLARVSTAVAERRTNLRRLIHSLEQLNGARRQGRRARPARRLVLAVFRAFASERRERLATVHELPGRAAQTTTTLARSSVRRRARPAAERAAARRASSTAPTARSRRSAREATPLAAREIRPFVREARPLVRDLKPGGERARQGHARPDAHVHGPQPPLQHGSATTPTAARADKAGPRGGLPLLAVVAAAHRGGAVLELRRATARSARSRSAAPARRSSRSPTRTRATSSSAPDGLLDPRSPHRPGGAEPSRKRMQKHRARHLPRLLTMVVFALSCFGLLLFLWLSVRRPDAAEAQGLPRSRSRSPRRRSSRSRPTCASPA
jgi:hypothetical protein